MGINIKSVPEKLRAAVEKARAAGVSDEQIATAIIHAKQGTKYSERNPTKVRPAVPSYVEEAIAKVCGVDPPTKQFYIGTMGAKPDVESMVEAVLDRKKIVETALAMNNRIPADRLKRYADAIFNDGFNVETIKKIAVLDSSADTSNTVADIFESAGIQFPTIDDAEGVATVARAILKHVMTHHKGDIGYIDNVTPFMAWRVKEKIVKGLLETERKLVGLDGYDCTKQMDEFDANFSKTDIVLWNPDIWNAATRKCEVFAGTKVDKAILDACMPMFWQFEQRFVLPHDVSFGFDLTDGYYCAGLCILPHSEDRIKADAGDGVRFLKKGISVSVIFLPAVGDDPPEIRYLYPLYEGDSINPKQPFQQAVLAAMQFLTLDFVSKDNVQISKKELKEDRALFRQVRKGRVNVPPIKIINLRRLARKEKAERDPSKPKRGFSCHWLTEPHWQRYHYADGTVKRIYKNTYVNGDVTKPFRPPREKVFKAVR